MGCPALITELTPEQEEIALNEAINCKPYSKIAKLLGFTNDMAFLKYRRANPFFEERLQATRTHAFEELAYSVLELVDKYADPQQARAQLDAIKNFLAWMEPQKYGQRLDLNITQTLDIAGAIERAKQHAEIDITPKRNTIGDLV